MSVDAAIFGDRNVIKKKAGNILTYKNLVIEIQRIWNLEQKIIPVIIGATGTI
jgi:3-deoxy-D-manno-octulosonic acid (KDO) 8-phosphate synthase